MRYSNSLSSLILVIGYLVFADPLQAEEHPISNTQYQAPRQKQRVDAQNTNKLEAENGTINRYTHR